MPRYPGVRSFLIASLFSAIAVAALFCGIAVPAYGQTLEPGPQVLSFYSEIDDSEQPYALYLPPNFDATRAYPLLVSLHGAGSNHRLNLRRVFGRSNAEGENDVEASRYFPEWEDVDYIVASPFARGTMGYEGVAEADVYDMLDDVMRRFPIDADRVYLTGLSMGGGGTLWLGLSRPDVWAALVPVCPAPPAAAEALAGNALQIPIHIHQGGADPVVQPAATRDWVERLRTSGADVEYTEYPGVGHDSWENAYAAGRVFGWLDQHRRKAYPDHVRFTSDRYRYDSAYWVQLDALTPGVHAEIDARFTRPNTLEIVTSNLEGFTLDLGRHPSFSPDSPVAITLDGATRTVETDAVASFHRSGGGWTEGRYERPEGAKRPGADGPMTDALAQRHLYVYGTADDPSDEEAARRQSEALVAAEWSVYRGPFLGRVMVHPRVAADRDVRPSDLETSHLVLFGTRETNALIERFADRLPMHWDGDAVGNRRAAGLSYVFPVDGRYVLVSSGVPWWERPEAGGSGSFRFGMEVPALTLPTDADYLLFDAEGVIAEGRFDAAWELPADVARAVRSAGMVTIGDTSE